jgi:predicted O-methyltransferase YrrM
MSIIPDFISRAVVIPVLAAHRLRRLRSLPWGKELAWGIDGVGDDRADGIERARLDLLSDGRKLAEVAELGPFDEPDATVAEATAVASRTRRDGMFLMTVADQIKPALILELGTNTGISTAYLAAGAPGAKVITIDASSARSAVARELLSKLGLRNVDFRVGLFEDTLPQVVRGRRIDMAFIDGTHEYRPTLDCWESIAPHCSEDAIVVFDDIYWSPEMQRAWADLKRDRRFSYTVNTGWMGLGILGEGPGPELRFGAYYETRLKS